MKVYIYFNPTIGEAWLTASEDKPVYDGAYRFSPWQFMGGYEIEDKISLLIDGFFGRPHIKVYQLEKGRKNKEVK